MKKFLLFAILFFWVITGFAQTYPDSDCVGATQVCSRLMSFPPRTGSGNVNDISAGVACFGQERGSIWLKVHITAPGLLGFNIIPRNPQQGTVNVVDLDFAVFNVTTSSCASLSNQNRVRCNASGSTFPSPATGLNSGPHPQDAPRLPVAAGETYYIVIVNFSGAFVSVDVDFSLSTCEFCEAEDSSSISGYVYRDRDNDCLKSVNDPPLSNRLVRLTPLAPGLDEYTGLTDNNGYYQIPVDDTGSYRLSVELDTASFEQVCPQQLYEIYFDGSYQVYNYSNIGIRPNQLLPESDCIGAIAVCGTRLSFGPRIGYGHTDEITRDGSPIFFCPRGGTASELNSFWLKVLITEPGFLGFNIIPRGEENEPADFDFAVFDLTGSSCASFDANNLVSCNYHRSTAPTSVTGLNNGPYFQDNPMLAVEAGETYYILIVNYNGLLVDIDVDFGLSTCGFCGTEGRSSVSGYVYMDRDSNCTKDPNDWGLANLPVRLTPLTPGLSETVTYTSANGLYLFALSDTGSYRINPPDSSSLFQIACPQQPHEIHFDGNQQSYSEYNIGYDGGTYRNGNPAGPCAQLRITQSTPFLRRCFNSRRIIKVYNEGNILLDSVQLSFSYDPHIVPISATIPLEHSGPGIWTATLYNLVPGRPQTISLRDSVSCTAPLLITACVEVEADIGHMLYCSTPSPENAVTSCSVIAGSYDPNDKAGFPLGEGDEPIIPRDQEIRYRIRFQNTGNDTAFTVVIRDTLTNLLDEHSVRPDISSHPYIFQQKENQLTFTFNQILLPDSTTDPEGSRGFVEFSVKQKTSNPNIYQIVNTASIYFDFNEPIHTAPSIHMVKPNEQTISLADVPGKSRPVLLYPNPAKGGFSIRYSEAFATLQLADLSGRLLLQRHNLRSDQWIGTGSLEAGLYIVRLIRPDGSYHAERLVMEE